MTVSKEQIEDLYIGQGLTKKQCAEMLGLPTTGAISWAIKKHGIVTRTGGVPVGHKRGEFSLSHRENLSKSHIGKAGFWTGKKRSSEDIEKFRKSHLGKKQSDETVRKRMESQSGENHYNWKGGITPVVRQVRRCFKYRQWRSEVFSGDEFSCVLCGKKSCWVEADHYPKSFSSIFNENRIENIQQALGCEELWDKNNGRTLCRPCHNNIHSKYESLNQQVAV